MTAPEDLTPAEAAKLALLANIGAHTGSEVVKALRTHAPCECLGCQMTVLSTAIQWAIQGQDVREAKCQMDAHIRDMLAVRRDIRDYLTYAIACEAAGVDMHLGLEQGNA